MKLRKHKCCECGKTAIWKNIMPNKGYPTFFCDKCVPREPHPMALDDFGEPTNFPNDECKIVWWDESAYGNDFKTLGSTERTDKSFYYEIVDKDGKRFPTFNFILKDEGYDMDESETKSFLNFNAISKVASDCVARHFATARDNFRVKDKLAELFVSTRTKGDKPQLVEYNRFMSKLGDYVCYICEEGGFNGKELQLVTFYRHFREEIRKYKVSC